MYEILHVDLYIKELSNLMETQNLSYMYMWIETPMMTTALVPHKIYANLYICHILDGERTKAHWDKSPLGQKPTGQYPTGQKPTAKFGRVDKSPLFEKKIGLSLL